MERILGLFASIAIALLLALGTNVSASDSNSEKFVENENFLKLGDDECLQLGLVRSNLSCISCDYLEKHDLSVLREHCYQCCDPHANQEYSDTKVGEPGLEKYASAKLEVCWCKFPSMPQIEAFVKGDIPKKFPNLSITHINGQNPIIKLVDKNGHVDQILSISKWDTDTIEEFLNTHLESEPKSSPAL